MPISATGTLMEQMQACLQEHQAGGWDPPFAPPPPSKPAASRKQQKKKAWAARRKSAQRTPVATPTQDTMPEHDVQPASPTLSPPPLADPVPPTLPNACQAAVGSSMDAGPPSPDYTGLGSTQQAPLQGCRSVSAALSTAQSPKAVSSTQHPQPAGSWAKIAAKGARAASMDPHRNDSGASSSGMQKCV